MGREAVNVVYPPLLDAAMRIVPCIALSLGAALSVRANACTIQPPPISETVKEVAAGGLLIRGRIVQEFDAERQEPEVIRADEIFIGEGHPRDFMIYHAKEDYNHVLELRKALSNGLVIAPCGIGIRDYKLG